MLMLFFYSSCHLFDPLSLSNFVTWTKIFQTISSSVHWSPNKKPEILPSLGTYTYNLEDETSLSEVTSLNHIS
ncbi:hypothetical protein P8452_59766 [Trifolium repens]|nr:hypothetical protein P8452_59766 [Trifolium repens]